MTGSTAADCGVSGDSRDANHRSSIMRANPSSRTSWGGSVNASCRFSSSNRRRRRRESASGRGGGGRRSRCSEDGSAVGAGTLLGTSTIASKCSRAMNPPMPPRVTRSAETILACGPYSASAWTPSFASDLPLRTYLFASTHNPHGLDLYSRRGRLLIRKHRHSPGLRCHQPSHCRPQRRCADEHWILSPGFCLGQ